MKILLNDDKKKVAAAMAALEENEGYCPCKLFKAPDSKCMCKEFREQTTPGLCHCGLYKKVED